MMLVHASFKLCSADSVFIKTTLNGGDGLWGLL